MAWQRCKSLHWVGPSLVVWHQEPVPCLLGDRIGVPSGWVDALGAPHGPVPMQAAGAPKRWVHRPDFTSTVGQVPHRAVCVVAPLAHSRATLDAWGRRAVRCAWPPIPARHLSKQRRQGFGVTREFLGRWGGDGACCYLANSSASVGVLADQSDGAIPSQRLNARLKFAMSE